jgi:hypothetical protein
MSPPFALLACFQHFDLTNPKAAVPACTPAFDFGFVENKLPFNLFAISVPQQHAGSNRLIYRPFFYRGE